MFKKEVAIFKALANDNRFRIFHLICRRPMCVCELTEILNISQATVSRHLQQLKNAGLIIDEKDIPWTQYRLSNLGHSPLAHMIVKYISYQLQQDPVLETDIRKAVTIDRYSLQGKDDHDDT